MTKSFGTNETNDLYIGTDGNLVVLDALPAVASACSAAAEAQRGEMILDTKRGIPNFRDLWNGNPNIPQWSAALQLALQNVDGVTNVSAIDAKRIGSTLEYRAVITTRYGQTILSGFLNGI